MSEELSCNVNIDQFEVQLYPQKPVQPEIRPRRLQYYTVKQEILEKEADCEENEQNNNRADDYSPQFIEMFPEGHLLQLIVS